MPAADFAHDPPLPESPPPLFAQRVVSGPARAPNATAAWQALAGVDGAYQLLWAEVFAGRRSGHGSAVLKEALRQAALHSQRVGRPMRRMMALVPQQEVVARAWLLRNGFIHAHTLDDFDRRCEVLVMIRTFD